jgi:hypothetical protein
VRGGVGGRARPAPWGPWHPGILVMIVDDDPWRPGPTLGAPGDQQRTVLGVEG